MDTKTLIALSIVVIFWASAFAGIRASLEAYTPGHLVLLRFLVASACMGVYAFVSRLRLPDKQDIGTIIVAGFLGFTVYHVSLTFGEVTVTAGAASLLIASAPIITAILSTIVLGERLRIWGWIGTAISFTGITLITLGAGDEVRIEPGALLILLSALATSGYVILQKPLLKKYHALELVTYAIWVGTACMLVFLPGLGQAIVSAPFDATLAAVYLGIFPAAVSYVGWSYALSRAPASIAVSFLYVIPVVAIIIAWFWLREIPTLVSLIGGGIVLVGVVLVNTHGYDQ